MRNETMGQLLPFAQSAQTLRRFAGKHRAQGNDLQAVEFLRMSLLREENDEETSLALAEAYAAIQCYALSNRILIPLIGSERVGEESIFGVGCNMLSLGMNDCARDCFVMYLQRYPGGERVQDAVEMLESCEEPEDALSPAQARVEKRVQRALEALDGGRAALAVRLLQRAVRIGKRNSGVYALLSFALLAVPDAKQAVLAARRALCICRDDLRARCAMAVSLYVCGAKKSGRAFLEKAAEQAQEEDEAMLVCHTACEMDAPDVVLKVLADTEADAPYCDDLLHLTACAHYNNGNREEAIRRWKLLKRIDPLDTVADYRLRAAEAGELPEKIPYLRQAPLEETLRRLSRLRVLVQEGAGPLQARLDSDDNELQRLLGWALTSDEEGVAKTAAGLLMSLTGPRADALLLGVLSDADAPRKLKHEALAALCVRGKTGPFHVVVDGRMTLVRVSSTQDQKAVRHDRIFCAAMIARLGATTEKEKEQVRALCEAVHRAGSSGSAVQMKIVGLAYRMMKRQQIVLPKRMKHRRRLCRIARRLVWEVENNGMH